MLFWSGGSSSASGHKGRPLQGALRLAAAAAHGRVDLASGAQRAAAGRLLGAQRAGARLPGRPPHGSHTEVDREDIRRC